MSKKLCCEWHDHLPEYWQDPHANPETDFGECGMAGMGRPVVCCAKCPHTNWFIKGRGMQPADIDFAKDIMALPIEQRP